MLVCVPECKCRSVFLVAVLVSGLECQCVSVFLSTNDGQRHRRDLFLVNVLQCQGWLVMLFGDTAQVRC